MRRKDAIAALNALDPAKFDLLGAEVIASRQFKAASVAVEVFLFSIIIGVASYLAWYLGRHSPPVTHRLFLLFVVFVTLPLATLKARELIRGWALERALLGLALAKGLIR